MKGINRTMLMVIVLLSMLVFLVTTSTASSAEAGKIKVGVAHALKHAEGKEFLQGVILAAEQVNAGGWHCIGWEKIRDRGSLGRFQ